MIEIIPIDNFFIRALLETLSFSFSLFMSSSTKKPVVTIESIIFPKHLDTSDCREAMAAWLYYKQERGSYYRGSSAIARIFNMFENFGEREFCDQIARSITANWAGIFPPVRRLPPIPIATPRPQPKRVVSEKPIAKSSEEIKNIIESAKPKAIPCKQMFEEDRRAALKRQIESIKNDLKKNS